MVASMPLTALSLISVLAIGVSTTAISGTAQWTDWTCPTETLNVTQTQYVPVTTKETNIQTSVITVYQTVVQTIVQVCSWQLRLWQGLISISDRAKPSRYLQPQRSYRQQRLSPSPPLKLSRSTPALLGSQASNYAQQGLPTQLSRYKLPA